MGKVIGALSLVMLIAISIALLSASKLDVELGSVVRLVMGSGADQEYTEKFARFGGRSVDVQSMYRYLISLDSEQLYVLRATDGLCQTARFDCRGLSRPSVLQLIDGAIHRRDDNRVYYGSLISLASVVVSTISVLIAYLAYLRKK